jgi:hypothetical protein
MIVFKGSCPCSMVRQWTIVQILICLFSHLGLTVDIPRGSTLFIWGLRVLSSIINLPVTVNCTITICKYFDQKNLLSHLSL